MTHGHLHRLLEGEAYIGMAGQGGLLLRRGTEVAWVEMQAGIVGHIPPGWAHRTVNVGEEPFTFLAVYPRLAGHDYPPVAREGMGARVLRARFGYRVVRDDGTEIAARR
jgi:glucose-6-phosphate isomerase